MDLNFISTSEGIWFYLSWAICVPLIMFSQCVLRVFSLRFSLFLWPLTQDLSFFFVVQVRVHAPGHTQPHGHGLVCRYKDTGKSGPGAPHSDPDLLWFTPRLSGQTQSPAGSQRRSRRASTSQRWDSRLAWRVFDVALAVLCYYITMPLISSSSCYFLVDRPWQPSLSL